MKINIMGMIRFYRYPYKYYKDIGCKFFEAYDWYGKMFRARDVRKWKEAGATAEEAWWARLYNVKAEDWKPLGGKIIGIAMAWPMAPDGIENLYQGMVRKFIPKDKNRTFILGEVIYNKDIDIPTFDADLDIPAEDIRKDK